MRRRRWCARPCWNCGAARGCCSTPTIPTRGASARSSSTRSSPPDQVPDGCPHWVTDGQMKLSAGWLIETAGFGKGYGTGRARVSGKHSLALTNRGGATTAELLDLAREIRDGVEAKFGIRLRPEAHLAGVTL